MDGRRAPQGLQAEDRIALGLSAAHLFYLVTFSMAGWAVLSSPLPGFLTVPLGLAMLTAGAALAWGRVAGRPLDRWAWLYIAYRARPRRGGPPVVEAADSSPTQEMAAQGRGAAPVDIDPGPRLLVLPSRLPTPAPSAHLRKRSGRGHRCLFFSYRGGTGKSTLAAEVAAVLAGTAAAPAPRVALLDLDFSSSSMAVRLGLDPAGGGGFYAAPDADCAVMERALQRHASGARVLLAPPSGELSGGTPAGSVPRLARLLAYLDDQDFDVVLLDARGGRDTLDSYLLEAADTIYYVFTPTAGGIYDLYQGVTALRRAGQREKLRLVANLTAPVVALDEVLGDLRVPLVARVPLLDAFVTAENSHAPAAFLDEFVAQALHPLAADIHPETGVGEPGWAQAVAGANRSQWGALRA